MLEIIINFNHCLIWNSSYFLKAFHLSIVSAFYIKMIALSNWLALCKYCINYFSLFFLSHSHCFFLFLFFHILFSHFFSTFQSNFMSIFIKADTCCEAHKGGIGSQSLQLNAAGFVFLIVISILCIF